MRTNTQAIRIRAAHAQRLKLVLRENRDGSLYWELYNLMQRDAKGLNRLREGTLLYGWQGE